MKSLTDEATQKASTPVNSSMGPSCSLKARWVVLGCFGLIVQTFFSNVTAHLDSAADPRNKQ